MGYKVKTESKFYANDYYYILLGFIQRITP